ncbi:MFS transporter [Metarhizium robertsii]|uniref:MFS transporter n=1 Tax=Metarhizium robertsii TaxID=568076 RepID=A0A0A1V2C5_9HYPO|nr:MFS transporter [Metarhizium robertsii]
MARLDDRLAPPDIRRSADLTDNEQQPLIKTDSHSNNDDAQAQAPHGSKSAFRPSSAVTACFALNILLEVGLYLIAIPMNQVLEGIICHNVSPAAPGPSDARCKDTTVQSELSFIRGWQVTFDTIPGLVTAVPYGIMADAYGRELVLGLSVLGGAMAGSFTVLVCSLPSVFSPRLVWLGSAFALVGGGAPVFNAVTFAIVSGVVSERKRSVVFLYIAAAVLGSQLVASPLVYVLINVDTWLPVYCGLGCLWLATAVAFSIPRMMLASSPALEHVKTEEAQESRAQAQPARYHRLMGVAKAAVWFARGNVLVVVLLLTFLVTSLGRLAQEIILQYITKRYGWSWSEVSISISPCHLCVLHAGLVLSLHAFFTLTLLTVILPVASQALARKTTLATQSRTLWLARISVSMSTLGAFTMGLSETVGLMAVGLALFALGMATPPFSGAYSRQLLTSVTSIPCIL